MQKPSDCKEASPESDATATESVAESVVAVKVRHTLSLQRQRMIRLVSPRFELFFLTYCVEVLHKREEGVVPIRTA